MLIGPLLGPRRGTAPNFLVSDVKLCVDCLEQLHDRHDQIFALKSCDPIIRGRVMQGICPLLALDFLDLRFLV